MSAETPEVLTVEEAAKFLRCGPKVVRRLCRLKRLPHRVIDRKGTIRISREAFAAFVRGEKPAA